MYIISSCLMGNNCKYNGGNNENPEVMAFAEEHSFCLACPETASGLKAPRPPAEHQGDRIIDREGKDLTEDFQRGVERTWYSVNTEARRRCETIEGAILKANSPSCGCGLIYDGTFTGNLVPGDGLFTQRLKEYGIPVITEKEIQQW